MLAWSTYLGSCHRIFMRAVGNSRTFYSGKEALLDKKDDRVRSIPFPTRRPTIHEVKRVHQLLITVEQIGVYCFIKFLCVSWRLFDRDHVRM